MTCKDCIHYEVCKKTRIMNPSHNYATECNDYNDRSRFVELPCKAGDIVYLITDGDVSTVHIDRVRIDEYSIMFDWYNSHTNEVGSFNLIEIGRHIYLSGNEVKQALKERE